MSTISITEDTTHDSAAVEVAKRILEVAGIDPEKTEFVWTGDVDEPGIEVMRTFVRVTLVVPVTKSQRQHILEPIGQAVV